MSESILQKMRLSKVDCNDYMYCLEKKLRNNKIHIHVPYGWKKASYLDLQCDVMQQFWEKANKKVPPGVKPGYSSVQFGQDI